MDLPLLFRVVWRFRLLFALGVFLAVTLSLLSYVRVDASDGFNVSYRDQEQWESLSTLFITSTGFPWGSVSDQAQTPSGADEDRAASGVDAGRLTTLAGLYMQLATSDPVLRLMLRDGPIDGQLQTFPVFSTNNSDGSQLPMVTFSAITASPESAMRLAQRHVRAFMTFIEREQVNSAIPTEIAFACKSFASLSSNAARAPQEDSADHRLCRRDDRRVRPDHRAREHAAAAAAGVGQRRSLGPPRRVSSYAGARDREPAVVAVVAASMLVYIVWALTTQGPLHQFVPLAALVAVGAVCHRILTRWDTMLAGLIAVIMLIPIRRYTMPGDLPFELEPYRVLVALLAAAWLSALLIDPRVRLRRSGFEGPLALIVCASVGSVIVNGNRISQLGVDSEVAKKLTFFASFLLVFYLVVAVTRTAGGVDLLVKTFVTTGAIVAMFAIYETRTGYNFFDHLAGFVPFIDINEYPTSGRRGGQIRATGSAQHPIALGAALVMLTPLAVYLARTSGRRRWYAAAGVLCLGSLATVSRTGVLMLLVVGVVFVWLRPKEAKRMWPALIPAIVVIHFAMPGALGTIRGAFFPKEA